MYPMYRFLEGSPLHEDDVRGIQHLYGEVKGTEMEERMRLSYRTREEGREEMESQ